MCGWLRAREAPQKSETRPNAYSLTRPSASPSPSSPRAPSSSYSAGGADEIEAARHSLTAPSVDAERRSWSWNRLYPAAVTLNAVESASE